MFVVDARGQACPKPVLMTKAAVQSGQEAIQTLVDNTTAVQNLTRFAASVGYTCSHEEKDGIYTVTLEKDPNATCRKPLPMKTLPGRCSARKTGSARQRTSWATT